MKILIAGDFCPIGRTEQYLERADYANLFNGFENITPHVDYAVVNFECPVTTSKEKIRKVGPCLKSENLNSFDALKFAGFDLLTLANNHIQDYGSQGVLDTIEHANNKGLETIGAGMNALAAAVPLIKDIAGVKVGFINIAENEFCAATNIMPGANTFDLIDTLGVINSLKKEVDKIILIYHGGREHYQLPTPEQRKRFRFFVENGVDAVVAHHTHCVSGFEYFLGKPIIYSLGNFIFDYKEKYQRGLWTEGMSVILSLERGAEDFSVELLPHVQGSAENSTLVPMEGVKKETFLQKINGLNEKIKDDELFREMWNSYLKTQESLYLSSLYIKNFYVRALFLKGFLPASLLKSSHNPLLLNILRCETHNEISKDILENFR